MSGMTIKQALAVIQTEVNYHAGSDTHYRAERLEQSLATLRAEIARLEAVEKAAHQWWDGKRPLFEPGCERFINPRLNCVTDRECALADALAAKGASHEP